MFRKIIQIDKEKCDGCGLCVSACHEGAIGLVDGKAVLLRDDYCEGLGDCLPVCPTNAITFEQREALEYNEAEVRKNREQTKDEELPCGCPGSHAKPIKREAIPPQASPAMRPMPSQLNQWPVQIKLAPVNAPYFKDANLLISADCAAYAHGNFHNEYMRKRITLIGCPKLDEGDYTEKLAAILKTNAIKSVTVIRMEVPCCGGIENAVKAALLNCGKMIPWQVVTLSTEGEVID